MKKKRYVTPKVQTQEHETVHTDADATPAAEPADTLAETTPAAAEITDTDVGMLKDQLSEAQSELEDLKDKYLRAKAEADNIRRRAEKEIANTRKYAVDRFAAEMLTVRDSLELANTVDLQEQDSNAVEKMLEGLELTLKQLDSVFSKFAIEVVAPEPGEKLDPERHQAMSIQESSEIPPNHIISVIQKGYALKDRLIRPAMVIVAKAAESAESHPPARENA